VASCWSLSARQLLRDDYFYQQGLATLIWLGARSDRRLVRPGQRIPRAAAVMAVLRVRPDDIPDHRHRLRPGAIAANGAVIEPPDDPPVPQELRNALTGRF
jgi:hypothetical protein